MGPRGAGRALAAVSGAGQPGLPRRKVEAFRVGVYQSYDDMDEPPMDPRQAAGSDGNLTSLNRVQFDDVWEQSREMPDGFMGMYY